MEFRRAAVRDAGRAKLMRRAAALLREADVKLCEAEIESLTLAIAACVWELESEASECQADALIEYEDTNPVGLKVDR